MVINRAIAYTGYASVDIGSTQAKEVHHDLYNGGFRLQALGTITYSMAGTTKQQLTSSFGRMI